MKRALATIICGVLLGGCSKTAPEVDSGVVNTTGCQKAGGTCQCAGGCASGFHAAPPPLREQCPQPCDNCGACSMWCCLPDDAGAGDGAPEAGSDAPAGDSGGCAAGAATEVGRLCVRGAQGRSGEQLAADQPVRFQIEPKGCFSSACTVAHEASCSVSASGSALTLSGRFCIETSGPCTLPDCGGAGFGECSSAALPAGSYTATLGQLSVDFTVPSSIDHGGVCDGDPF